MARRRASGDITGSGQRLEFLFDFAVRQRISRIALGIVELRRELAPINGVDAHDHTLQRREDLLDVGVGNHLHSCVIAPG